MAAFLFLELEKKLREKTFIFCHWQFVFFLSLRFFEEWKEVDPKYFMKKQAAGLLMTQTRLFPS